MEIKQILQQKTGQEVKAKGWVRFNRVSKNIGFIELFDGSSLNGIQLIYKAENKDIYDILANVTLFSAIQIEGKTAKGKDGTLEVEVLKIIKINAAQEEYPLGKKDHGLEFLRKQAHLRPRTKLFHAIMKIRSDSALAIHEYFTLNDYHYIHAPIITKNDAEGAGETFEVKTQDGKPFFSHQGSLSVSGQLHAEAYAQAFRKVYTFAPTFRAENSNTTRHASEFWMVEPEVTFCDYNGMMDIAEEMIKFITKKILEKDSEELDFLSTFNKMDLEKVLTNIVSIAYKRISYEKAIEILKAAKANGVKFEIDDLHFGMDLASEHEKYLSSIYAKGPIFVFDYPKEIKSFYMFQNDDGKTSRGFDLLVPSIGELIGGSQREEDYEKLLKTIKEKGLKVEGLEWYIDFRKNGYAPSSGFGLGFERLVMLLTGTENIRDVLPFPRTPGELEF